MSEHVNLQAIARLVPHGARVLDLGCGDGALLDHLQKSRGCTGYGVELDDANIHAALDASLNVGEIGRAHV